MARRLRHTPEGGALFDVTCRTVQSRFLLRPCPLLNEIILGALARAKRRYGVEISAFIFLSNHLHILAWATDSEQLARFMGYFLSKLAREVSRLTGWRDKVFARRYQAIPISEEEAAQVERLVYILSNGCKEDLVARPQDWPGVHCVNALLTGKPLEGTWFDRTQEFAARNRGESFGPRKYAMPEILELDPLPCWRHLSKEQYRSRMAGLVEKITVETADHLTILANMTGKPCSESGFVAGRERPSALPGSSDRPQSGHFRHSGRVKLENRLAHL